MSNEDRDNVLYKYPESSVLRNKFDIRDPVEFDRAERHAVGFRIAEGVPSGKFDLDHLKAIHGHLFQDVYDWAGQIRQTDIHKTHWFMPHDRIEMAMADVHKRLGQEGFLKELKPDQFAKQAGVILGDVNHIHPFREGNGRTQFQYLKQLGAEAGHTIDLTRFEREEWIQASMDANEAKYERMQDCIAKAIESRERSPEQDRLQALRDRAVSRAASGADYYEASYKPQDRGQKDDGQGQG